MKWVGAARFGEGTSFAGMTKTDISGGNGKHHSDVDNDSRSIYHTPFDCFRLFEELSDVR